MEDIKCVVLRKGESSPGTGCPYCGSSNVTSEKKFDVTVKGQIIGHSRCGVRTVNELYEYTCEDCSKKYIVDMGKSKYICYIDPLPTTCANDEFLLAEYASEWHHNLSIYKSDQVCVAADEERKYMTVYYIFQDEDHTPIFISEKLAKMFIKDLDEAREFAGSIWMNRYR